MRSFVVVVLTVIAGVVIFAAYEQHLEMHRQKVERMRDALRGCWAVAPNSDLCATLAQQLVKRRPLRISWLAFQAP
jgi:hypothetical protein